MTTDRLAGRVCVVNGAASVIGQAVAERFAGEGGVVVGVDQVEHTVGELAVRADLADEAQVKAMYERVVREYGRLDVLYNNTGLMDPGDRSALDTSLQTWRRVQDANLTSIFLSCKHGIPHLRNTEPAGGSVINAASFLAGLGAATAQMAYAAAKAGVVQLTRDLGVHLARSGVRVNAVLFGPIDTAAQRAVFERNGAAARWWHYRSVHRPGLTQPLACLARRSNMAKRVACLTFAAGFALVLAGCGTQQAGPAGPHATTSAAPSAAAGSPRQRAAADVARIIASFPRPPGAVRTGLIASLTAPGEGPAATPDVATATQWWRAPGRPQAVLAWIRAHVPAGFTLGGTGSGSYEPGPTAAPIQSWTDEFELPPVPGVLTQRWLVVLVVADGNQTAIRADAQVVWLPARPAAERIPADARVVTITPVFGLQPVKRLERLDPVVTVTDPAKVAAIAAVIDELPLFPPGAFSCPADFGAYMKLTFRTSRDGPVVARLTAEYGGCGTVSVIIDGRSMPALSDYSATGQQLQQRVLAIAGARWPYRPGSPG